MLFELPENFFKVAATLACSLVLITVWGLNTPKESSSSSIESFVNLTSILI